MDRRAVRLWIRGRVHGVGYRVWTMETGRALGLDGWSRNRLDGTVEVLAMGEVAPLIGLVDACRNGPPGAVVDSLEWADAEDDGTVGFHIRHTL